MSSIDKSFWSTFCLLKSSVQDSEFFYEFSCTEIEAYALAVVAIFGTITCEKFYWLLIPILLHNRFSEHCNPNANPNHFGSHPYNVTTYNWIKGWHCQPNGESVLVLVPKTGRLQTAQAPNWLGVLSHRTETGRISKWWVHLGAIVSRTLTRTHQHSRPERESLVVGFNGCNVRRPCTRGVRDRHQHQGPRGLCYYF